MIAVIVLLEPDLEEGRRNTESQKVYWDCDYLGFSWSSVCKNSYCFLPLVNGLSDSWQIQPDQLKDMDGSSMGNLRWADCSAPPYSPPATYRLDKHKHGDAMSRETGILGLCRTSWHVGGKTTRWWFWHGVFLCFFLKIDCEIISILRLVWEFRDDFACCNASHTCARCVVVIVLLVLLLVPLLLLLM